MNKKYYFLYVFCQMKKYYLADNLQVFSVYVTIPFDSSKSNVQSLA